MQSLALAATAGTAQKWRLKAAAAPNARKLWRPCLRHQARSRIDRIHTPAGAATFSPLALAAPVPSYKWMPLILSVMLRAWQPRECHYARPQDFPLSHGGADGSAGAGAGPGDEPHHRFR